MISGLQRWPPAIPRSCASNQRKLETKIQTNTTCIWSANVAGLIWFENKMRGGRLCEFKMRGGRPLLIIKSSFSAYFKYIGPADRKLTIYLYPSRAQARLHASARPPYINNKSFQCDQKIPKTIPSNNKADWDMWGIGSFDKRDENAGFLQIMHRKMEDFWETR